MIRTLPVILVLSALGTVASAADGPQTYPLWPNGTTGSDAGDENHAGDIPTITVYLPLRNKTTGASIVICPGGGYDFLAADHDGKSVAEWLNTLGFEKGPHGLGLGKGTKRFNIPPEPSFEAWPPLCATWLNSRRFLDKR